MATMIPDLSATELASLPSRAEAKLYEAFRSSLPKDYLVLHSAKWILKSHNGKARDGEADFLVCAGDHGLLAIEVKGGGIQVDATNRSWVSIDAHGNRNAIKNPFEQALTAKYAIRAKLKEHSLWSRDFERVPFGHAVFFPDLGDVARLCRPDAPRAIIGSQGDIDRLHAWIDAALAFWAGEQSAFDPVGARVAALVKDVFARPVEVMPLLSWRLAEEEHTHIRLTDRQARTLGMLGGRRRAAIAGGAGTGKTLLAVDKARKLAAEGFNTLLTCYNRPLADHLQRSCSKVERLEVMSFHQLCSSWIEEATKLSGRKLLDEAAAAYPGRNLYDVHMPFALANSLEYLTRRFDAIVVDEGQDFREEFWMPLEMILQDPDASPLYIFYDQNQNLYHRVASFPIKDEPFVLTTNCRNTRIIHEAAYRFFKGETTDPPEIPGAAIEVLSASSISAQAERVHALITRLISREKVRPADISVLLLDARNRTAHYDQLTARSLPKPAVWRVETHGDANGVLLETANRFKGLEAAVVVLWGLDTMPPEQYRELLYVSISRAKSVLILCGTERACKQALAAVQS